jgi:NAD(P)-dependent dehydrogenase (short-subunit alcohol dehydrogenase family)
MTTFRASPNGGAAWVTGGSKGIGRELVLALAREGYMVAATARGREDLEEVARAAHGLPGTVFAFPGDVTDPAAMEATVAAIEDKVGPIALAVFNAGNYFPTKGERLDVANFVKTYEVNVFGVVNGLVPVVRRMQERRRGHVAIVGSVSSYFGWPTTAAYGATKAALNNMAESLKYDFDRMNIRIQMINPGFIDTPLTSKNSFAMPALMAPEKAAARIVAGLRSGGFEMTFPRRFTWFLKFLRILPQPIRYAFINRVTGWHKRPLSTRR